MKCSKCQRENPEDAIFCNQCGHNLQSSEQTSPIDFNKPNSYTPKFLADKILTSRSAMEGERKRVTVLFADVAGFTSMSEKLDPEEVHQIMDGCFKILMDEIHNHQGTINQFTGDGVMALFGAPIAIENHAQNACQASLAIQKSIKRYSHALMSKYGFEFKMRIGLNSGPVIVGSIGDDLRMDYTAIGDTTNLAARMESMAEPGTVLVSPTTYKGVSQYFKFNPLGKIGIKGKESLQEIYNLAGELENPGVGFDRQIFSEMMGRDKDLSKLELQVIKASSAEGSVVNVIGEAGIGKSRLITELKNRDVVKRVNFLEGRAISIGRNLSFHPIINLLKHWARIEEKDTPVSALSKLETAIRSVCPEEINEIFPFVATLMGMQLSGKHAERMKGIEGEALEKLILKNVKDLVKKSTELIPLVIVIEDLHWADDSSIKLLESMFSLAETHRILFINVFRPNHPETSDRIIETVKDKLPVYSVEINLQPLNGQMSEALISNMLNLRGIPHSIVNQIIQRADGNPFFIEEVVRSFIDEGVVVRNNGEFKVTEKIEEMVIPHTINDVLMARIDRLDENTRDLVKVASVIGRSFFYRILSEVVITVDGIDDRLSYLKQIELIRERLRMEELEYLFKHALAQEAAYESILQQKRKNLHLQVAQSIEKVFEQRLHEFYGMLALHYSKGDDYDKAEHYLIKAGEEAIRSSASSEALNYYQEGLKLYLKSSSNHADPEKLAMFEKNIAIAYYNKSRWVEAVEHIENVFRYWDIPTSNNKLLILLTFTKNILSIMTGLDRVLQKTNPFPAPRQTEIFDLYHRQCTALSHFDNIRCFFSTFYNFNKVITVNAAKSPGALDFILGTAAVLAYSGISFEISHKLLKLAKNLLDANNIQHLIAYHFAFTTSHLISGDWDRIGSLELVVVDTALRSGKLWNTIMYLYMFFIHQTETGDFQEANQAINKLSEISTTYDYLIAGQTASGSKAELLIKRGQFLRALEEEKHCIQLTSQLNMELSLLIHLGIKAEALIMLNDVDGAQSAIHETDEIVRQQKVIPAIYSIYSFIAKFVIDIHLLKSTMSSKDNTGLIKLINKTKQSGKTALKKSKKYAPHRTKILRLMGEYYWLTGKQKKAIKWWDKAIKKGEELGARPDLSRTYFEIGKSLREPDSKYKELNGITADEYLNKAKTMFEEMDLQWDLDELDKVMSTPSG